MSDDSLAKYEDFVPGIRNRINNIMNRLCCSIFNQE